MVVSSKTRKPGMAGVLLALTVLWVLGSLAAPPVQAGSGVYSEDFTTRAYKDETTTNVTGWGSGVLRLSRNITWGSYVPGDDTQAVQVVGDLMYYSLFHPGGVVITNVSNAASPQQVGLYPKMYTTYGMCVSGDYAYLAGQADSGFSYGLSIVIVTDPTNPASLSNCTTNAPGADVYKTGNYAYLGTFGGGLLTVSVANPAIPSVVDQDDNGLDYSCLDGAGSYVYAGVSNRFQVFSISTPANPTKLGYCDLIHYIDHLSVSGGYAYAACHGYGLYIINITNPASPNVVGSYSIPDGADSVFALGGYAYVGSYNYSLCILDVANPASPYPIGRWSDPISHPDDVYVMTDYAYVGFAGGVYVVDLSNLDSYVSPAAAQSLTVYTGPAGATLINATLWSTGTQPTGTAISYYLSPDGGLNWEPVTPGVVHTFTNVGQQLKWKALLTTSDAAITPEIASLTIIYETMMRAPSLVAPDDDTLTSEDTPTFQWTSIVGASEYLLQLDQVATFDSADLMTFTTATNSYTPTTGLPDGQWYWRVAARDSQNELGFFSASRMIAIDTTPPAWITSPVDQVVECGSGFRYDLNASDASGIDLWWINDTTRFVIGVDGLISDLWDLDPGTYGLEVTAYDPLGHSLSATFSVIYRDTTAPEWVIAPTDDVIHPGMYWDLTLEVTDFSQIDRWEISDTVNFGIEYFSTDRVRLYNVTALVPGVYDLSVTVWDEFDNALSASFTVTVQPITTPPPIPGFPLPAIAIGLCTALIPVVALRRRRRP